RRGGAGPGRGGAVVVAGLTVLVTGLPGVVAGLPVLATGLPGMVAGLPVLVTGLPGMTPRPPRVTLRRGLPLSEAAVRGDVARFLAVAHRVGLVAGVLARPGVVRDLNGGRLPAPGPQQRVQVHPGKLAQLASGGGRLGDRRPFAVDAHTRARGCGARRRS